MERVTAVPYYSSGALLGLFLGYAYIWLQVIQLLPGLGWLADAIRAVLPKKHAGSTFADPYVQALPESFAVLDANSLGSALYEMSASSEGPATPHPSFQDQQSAPYNAAVPAAAAAATATEDARMLNSASNAITPAVLLAAAGGFATAAAAAAAPEPVDQEQLLMSLRERLSSFPVDSLSPATTATALSLLTGGLAPGGNLAYDEEVSPCMDMTVGPIEPVEGELDLNYTHSNSNNLLPLLPSSPEASTSPAAPAGPEEPATAAAGPEPVPVLSLPANKFAKFAAVGSSSSSDAAAAVDAARSANRHTGSPGVTRSPTRHTAGPTHRSRPGRSDIVPLTDRAVQELNRQNQAADGYRNAVGSPRAAYAVGLPAQRAVLITQRSCTSSVNSGSSSSSPCKVPTYQQQQRLQEKGGAQGSPATGAAAAVARVGPGALGAARALNLAFSAADDDDKSGAGPPVAASAAVPAAVPAAAAAKGDLAGGDAASDAPPEQPATPRTVSSIHTTDSAATVERKKRLGGRLFAALKQKAVKGRQQVR